MKTIIAILSLVSISLTAAANDGGVVALKVDQIKMRETAVQNGKEVVVKKIVNPRYTITLEGGEAAQLQKLLPSSKTTLGLSPDQDEVYKDSFKSLGIYSEHSAAASSKILSISCHDAVMSQSGDRVIKTGKAVCTISIQGVAADSSAKDYLGDIYPLEPKTCK